MSLRMFGQLGLCCDNLGPDPRTGGPRVSSVKARVNPLLPVPAPTYLMIHTGLGHVETSMRAYVCIVKHMHRCHEKPCLRLSRSLSLPFFPFSLSLSLALSLSLSLKVL